MTATIEAHEIVDAQVDPNAATMVHQTTTAAPVLEARDLNVDFWVDDKDGKLKVGEVRIHKVPVQEDGLWRQEFRYKFDALDTEDVK